MATAKTPGQQRGRAIGLEYPASNSRTAAWDSNHARHNWLSAPGPGSVTATLGVEAGDRAETSICPPMALTKLTEGAFVSSVSSSPGLSRNSSSACKRVSHFIWALACRAGNAIRSRPAARREVARLPDRRGARPAPGIRGEREEHFRAGRDRTAPLAWLADGPPTSRAPAPECHVAGLSRSPPQRRPESRRARTPACRRSEKALGAGQSPGRIRPLR